MNVAVVFGGNTVEHEISILTGIQVLNSIHPKKYHVIPIFLNKSNQFMIGENFDCVDTFRRNDVILEEVMITQAGVKKKGKFSKIIPIDVVINATHGYGCESGELAGFFSILNIPYTSSDVLAASIGQDKITFKKILNYDHIPTLPFLSYDEEDFKTKKEEIIQEVETFKYPVIVKPSNLGSSIGIKKVLDQEQLLLALHQAFKYDKRVLIEPMLESFREFNCAVLDRLTSSVEEVITNHSFLTFEDKYESTTEHILPAHISNDLENEIMELAKKVYKTIQNKGVSRIDFLYDAQNNQLYVNEINTIPGSLAYYLFEDKGIYFDELLDILIEKAIQEDYYRKQKIKSFPSNALNFQGKQSKLKIK